MSRSLGWITFRGFMIAAGIASTGCYSYAYQVRDSGVDHQRIATELYPHSDVRWSMWWGMHEDEWSPIECVENGSKDCVQVPYCDKGIGRMEASYTAATFLMTVVTLGIAVPIKVSVWCATDSGPRHGP